MTTKSPPWKGDNPKPASARTSLTAAEKAEAKSAAKKAGRPYPNLVDTMRVAAKKKSSTKKAAAKKAGKKKSAVKKVAAKKSAG